MKSRMSVEGLSIFLLLILIGYFIADFGLLFVRGRMYPQPAPQTRGIARFQPPRSANVQIIKDRNIFNADGKIPPPYGNTGEEKKVDDGPPVPTSEPIQLVGTLVHANPKRSVASIALKQKNDQVALKVDATIPDGIGTILTIERNKVVFRNLRSQRREFIEMKEEAKLSFGAAQKAVQVGEVTVKSETEREMKRSDIDRLTSNLPELLQQARAVPRMGPGGQIECFSLADIAPGSIYERLGLQRGDCIKSVNGERIDSPAKAMELYNALRANANSINLGIERGGRDNNFNYNITQ